MHLGRQASGRGWTYLLVHVEFSEDLGGVEEVLVVDYPVERGQYMPTFTVSTHLGRTFSRSRLGVADSVEERSNSR